MALTRAIGMDRDVGITRRALIYRMERHGLKPRPGDG